MENKNLTDEINSNKELTREASESAIQPPIDKKNSNVIDASLTEASVNNKKKTLDKSISSKPSTEDSPISKKPPKPPKLEDKAFSEFILEHFIPGLKSSIQDKGILVADIKLIEGKRPVVGGDCWMVFCEISEQRRFWLCFNKEIITSDKTILLAESNSEPSIVESFLIDEKKTTLPLLISRVLQRLNGQKWLGYN